MHGRRDNLGKGPLAQSGHGVIDQRHSPTQPQLVEKARALYTRKGA